MLSQSWRIPALAFTCLSSFAIASCSSTPPKGHVDLQPVKDIAPYWCQVVPKNALHNVTAVDRGLRQNRDIDIHNTLTSCEVGNDTKLSLEVQLALDGEARFQEKEEFEHNRSEIQLPPELGQAIFRSAPEAPNYTAASAFQCGKRLIWIRIIIRPVIQGRDPKEDLPAFLDIAEKRYARLARCTILPGRPTPMSS
jgi:hypothetical protein